MPTETWQQLWSRTAKWWFLNEDFVITTFNDWQNNSLAKKWLVTMNYNIDEIEKVHAVKITWSYKADVQVQIKIEIKLKEIEDVQNIQVKLVSNPSWFNQIDKRRIKKYKELWDIPANVEKLLKYYTWEEKPYIKNPRDERRMFIDEFSKSEQNEVLWFFRNNKTLIVSDILKWRWQFAAERMLVILKIGEKPLKWALKPINFVLNYFWNGDVEITKQWNLKLWKITIQRKWWDAWRDTSKMLQFKINPCEIIDL